MPQNNDALFEQLYPKKKTTKEYALAAAIVLAILLLISVVFILCWTYIPSTIGVTIQILAIAGIIYGGFKYLQKLNIEYEYIYLNGETDVDKIFAKSDRKRLVTVKFDTIEQFGEYNDATKAKIDSYPAEKRIDVRSNTNKPLYYIIFKHREFGKTVLIYEPDERILDDMKKRLPRGIWQ